MDSGMIPEFAKDQSVLIFGAVYCKYCKMAKKLMEEKNGSFTYVDLDDYEHIELKETLKKLNNVETIPIIYKKYDEEYKFIGGYQELVKNLKVD